MKPESKWNCRQCKGAFPYSDMRILITDRRGAYLEQGKAIYTPLSLINKLGDNPREGLDNPLFSLHGDHLLVVPPEFHPGLYCIGCAPPEAQEGYANWVAKVLR